MTKQTIEVEGLPEGRRIVQFRDTPDTLSAQGYLTALCEDGTLWSFSSGSWSEFPLIPLPSKHEKIQPRRIVLEETEEKHLGCQTLYIDDTEFMIMTDKVWREVKENDLSLTNAEPKLSLSVDECKEAMRKLETFNVTDLSVKICRFLKDK